MKVLLKRFHLNGHVTGLHPQTQKFKQLCKSPMFTLKLKELISQLSCLFVGLSLGKNMKV